MDTDAVNQRIIAIYRHESGRVLATLIRLLHGNFDLAEEAMQDAFTAALVQWPQEGIPDNPRAWLVSTGRFKAIDRLRRHARLDRYLEELAQSLARPVYACFNRLFSQSEQIGNLAVAPTLNGDEDQRLAKTKR